MDTGGKELGVVQFKNNCVGCEPKSGFCFENVWCVKNAEDETSNVHASRAPQVVQHNVNALLLHALASGAAQCQCTAAARLCSRSAGVTAETLYGT